MPYGIFLRDDTMEKMTDGVEKFKSLFISEAEDRLATLSRGILELENKPNDIELYAALMRDAHTVKGSAATMGYKEMADLAHALEDVFHAGARGALLIGKTGVSTVLASFDGLSASLVALKENRSELPTRALVSALRGLLAGEDAPAPAVQIPKFQASDSVKVEVKRLDALMGLFEEMLLLRLKLDTMLEPAAEITRTLSDPLVKQRLFFIHEFKTLFGELARLLSETQIELLHMRLVPLEQIFGQFPRMVRDLALKEKKKVEFRIEGAHIELDRSVLDGLGGALSHLLRNAVDHGIVDEGKVTLSALRSKDRVEIIVEDTGRGIDYVAIEKIARLRGVLGKEKIANKSELSELIFHPYVSTNKEVTEISGRGVGLFAVKEFAQGVGGRVSVVSPTEAGGTRFLLNLPISLATMKVLLVESRGFVFAVPFANIVRTFSVSTASIVRAAHQESVVVDGRSIPALYLERVLGLRFGAHFEGDVADTYAAVLLSGEKSEILLLVDECAGEEELLIKALPPVLRKIKGFSGSALIPDGRTILLLDVYGLFAHALGDILGSAEFADSAKSVPPPNRSH